MRIWSFRRAALGISAAAMSAGCGALPLSLSKGQDDTQLPIGANGASAIITSAIRQVQSHHRTFRYTGGAQSFKVPAGVTSIDVDARGAAGAGQSSPSGSYAGRGGRVRATISVQPGQTLAVFVGGEGLRQAGGFNGGGSGGPSSYACTGGLGGGGGSDVREDGDTLPYRVLVAGGGGGQGVYAGSAPGDDATSGGYNGGGGGGKKGGNGQPLMPPYGKAGGGAGGTQSKGGAGGAGGGVGYQAGGPGTLGMGGSGGNCTYRQFAGSSGSGGGGGYYGGGGGGGGTLISNDGAGGGGSGYVESGATNIHFQRGWWDAKANGEIVFSW